MWSVLVTAHVQVLFAVGGCLCGCGNDGEHSLLVHDAEHALHRVHSSEIAYIVLTDGGIDRPGDVLKRGWVCVGFGDDNGSFGGGGSDVDDCVGVECRSIARHTVGRERFL